MDYVMFWKKSTHHLANLQENWELSKIHTVTKISIANTAINCQQALEKEVPENLVNIVDTLRALGKVKKACFGKTVDPNYKQILKDFDEK